MKVILLFLEVGGFDTSAIAIDAALNANSCDILTDVDGIYTEDPNLCLTAKKMNKISYDKILYMINSGSKVMNYEAINFAKKYKVKINVKSSSSTDKGTQIS